MENKLVIGILDIVEDKLREFGVTLPDDDREDSKDPIVGYQYAELHDRIKEYLEAQGVAFGYTGGSAKGQGPREGIGFADDFNSAEARGSEKVKVYGISIVDSNGFMNGNDSDVHAFGSLQECLSYAYDRYCAAWKDIEEACCVEYVEDGLLSQAEFEHRLKLYGSVVHQLPDSHVAFERFEWEVGVPRELAVDAQIRAAMERSGGTRDVKLEKDLEY